VSTPENTFETHWYLYGYGNQRRSFRSHLRKAFTVSEQVAIADAIAEKLAARRGGDRISSEKHFPLDAGRNIDIAAAKSGLGLGKTYGNPPDFHRT